MMSLSSDHSQPAFRALADPTRRAILALLKDGDMPVNDIAARFDMTRPAVSKHLTILEEGGLIISRKDGRERINALRPEGFQSAAQWISTFSEFWDDRLAKLKHAVENTQ